MSRPTRRLASWLSVAPALGGALLWGGMPAPLAAQELPQGWEVRPDQGGHDHGGGAPEGLVFEGMAPGWRVTTGPAVILWQPTTVAEGDFRVEMEVHMFDPGSRREAFGIFMGGSDLHGDGQRYSYILLREGGQYLVKKRNGAETPTLVGWTSHPAIRGWADRTDGGSTVLNNLVVEAVGDRVVVTVNGEEVATLERNDLDTGGIVGLRVNHGLNLHVSRFEVTPLE